MPRIQHRSRIHLLAAKEAPTVVILQRKRAKLFHVIRVDTETHGIEEGSWFRGVLHGLQCDVSFDGKYMVYLARGMNHQTWSGLCRLPWLTTLIDAEYSGAWGGGYFKSREVLVTNVWRREASAPAAELPFTLEAGPLSPSTSEPPGLLYVRMERDGYTRLGPSGGEEQWLTDPFRVPCVGDDGWGKRPTPAHPQLEMRYLGFFDHANKFAFSLEEHPDIVAGASWATWDANGSLWVARPGTVEQFTLADLRRGTPSFSLDVDRFERPPRQGRSPDEREAGGAR